MASNCCGVAEGRGDRSPLGCVQSTLEEVVGLAWRRASCIQFGVVQEVVGRGGGVADAWPLVPSAENDKMKLAGASRTAFKDS